MTTGEKLINNKLRLLQFANCLFDLLLIRD